MRALFIPITLAIGGFTFPLKKTVATLKGFFFPCGTSFKYTRHVKIGENLFHCMRFKLELLFRIQTQLFHDYDAYYNGSVNGWGKLNFILKPDTILICLSSRTASIGAFLTSLFPGNCASTLLTVLWCIVSVTVKT